MNVLLKYALRAVGIVRYTVTATDPQGWTVEWKPFDVEASQLTIIK